MISKKWLMCNIRGIVSDSIPSQSCIHEENHSKLWHRKSTLSYCQYQPRCCMQLSGGASGTECVSHNMRLLNTYISYPFSVTSCTLTSHQRGFLCFTGKTKASIFFYFFHQNHQADLSLTTFILHCIWFSHLARSLQILQTNLGDKRFRDCSIVPMEIQFMVIMIKVIW